MFITVHRSDVMIKDILMSETFMILVNADFVFLFVEKMGYANTEQTARGIHTRLFSRAFIVDDGSKRVVFVTADIGMVSQRLRLEVAHTLFRVSSSVVMGIVYIKHFSYNSMWVIDNGHYIIYYIYIYK